MSSLASFCIIRRWLWKGFQRGQSQLCYKAATALWLVCWPGDWKVPGSMPSMPALLLLFPWARNFTPLAHLYHNEFSEFSPNGVAQVWRPPRGAMYWMYEQSFGECNIAGILLLFATAVMLNYCKRLWLIYIRIIHCFKEDIFILYMLKKIHLHVWNNFYCLGTN